MPRRTAAPFDQAPFRRPRPGPSRRTFRIVGVVAALGVLGTLIFGILYATKSSGQVQDPAVISAPRPS